MGNAAGAVLGLTITSLRKAGKAVETVSKILMKLIKLIKKQRNLSRGQRSGNSSHDKTPLPQKSVETVHGKKQKEEGQHVQATIRLSRTVDESVAYIEEEKKQHHLPAKLTLGITGSGKQAYKGKGTITIESGSATLFEDAAMTTPAQTSYSHKALIKGQVLYVKAADLNKITLKHSLSPQSGFTIGKPKQESVEVKPFKRIYLHAFSGNRNEEFKDNFKDLLAEHKKNNTKGPDGDTLLLYTGHVGISFNQLAPIYAFNPDTGDEAGWYTLARLKSPKMKTAEPYPGIVTDDTSVFKKARAMNLDYRILHYLYTESLYDKVHKEFKKERQSTSLTYTFPEARGDCNCATWPKEIGIPIPYHEGTMKLYIQSFNHKDIIVISGENNK